MCGRVPMPTCCCTMICTPHSSLLPINEISAKRSTTSAIHRVLYHPQDNVDIAPTYCVQSHFASHWLELPRLVLLHSFSISQQTWNDDPFRSQPVGHHTCESPGGYIAR